MTIQSGDLASVPAILPVRNDEERTWSTLAHLSILLNLVTGWFGIAGALLVYVTYGNRSRTVRFHALQSLFFQLAVWIIPGILIAMSWMAVLLFLPLLGVGLLLIPLAILVSILVGLAFPASIIYGIIAAVQCHQGQSFRYWKIAEWVDGLESGGERHETGETMGVASGSAG